MMQLSMPNNNKLLRSAGISAGAVLAVIGLKFMFPEADLNTLQAAILTAVSGWLINTVRESLK